jgi:Raf kinase inhibitor-like YbhB/YbcL family protein
MTGRFIFRLFLVLAACAWLEVSAPRAFCQDHPIQVKSPDFSNGGMIPARFTCDGQNTPPTLRLFGVPATAKSLVLVVDDPDAPGGTFTHWLVWNINPASKEIGAATKGAAQGRNDFDRLGYGGPCPPSGVHHYRFKVYALDAVLKLPSGSGRTALELAIQGHIAAQGMLVGEYARASAAH